MSIAQPGGIASATPSRHALAQLATGGFLLLAGALFAAPFLLSGRAQENDVFLTNLFLAPLIALLGSVLYLIALRGFGLSIAWLVALLVINVAALTGWLWLPQFTSQSIPVVGVILAADAILLFSVGALLAAARELAGPWALGLLLAILAAAALAAIYYFFGGQYLAAGETSSSLPPYLNTIALVATAVLAVLTYLVGWLWGRAR
jgi:hypothetical protein